MKQAFLTVFLLLVITPAHSATIISSLPFGSPAGGTTQIQADGLNVAAGFLMGGAALLNFISPSFTLDFVSRAYTFTPAGPFTLLANTNYWIVVDGVSDGVQSGITWSAKAETPVGSAATYLGQTQDGNLPPTSVIPGNNVVAFQVHGTLQGSSTPIPEPTTAAFAALGLGLAAVCRRLKS